MWKLIWKFVCPLIFLAILTCIWLEYEPPSYDGVTFPFWSTVVGWVISTIPTVLIFCTGIVMFCKKNGSISERWQQLLCPEDDWGPALAVHRAEYYPLQIPEATRLMPPIRYTSVAKRQERPLLRDNEDTLVIQGTRPTSVAPISKPKTLDDRETII